MHDGRPGRGVALLVLRSTRIAMLGRNVAGHPLDMALGSLGNCSKVGVRQFNDHRLRRPPASGVGERESDARRLTLR